jgi:hypothetical protein
MASRQAQPRGWAWRFCFVPQGVLRFTFSVSRKSSKHQAPGHKAGECSWSAPYRAGASACPGPPWVPLLEIWGLAEGPLAGTKVLKGSKVLNIVISGRQAPRTGHWAASARRQPASPSAVSGYRIVLYNKTYRYD